jgi:hypothetical protein
MRRSLFFTGDKGNSTMVPDTADYNWKIAALLEDHSYRKLRKDPTESVERKTVLPLKKSSIYEEVCHQLRPQSSWPPRLYGLLKIYKQGASLRPIVRTNGASTYRFDKHLAGLMGPHTGNSLHHVKNWADFARAGPQDIM